jgi:chemotaxis protein CheX
VRISGSWGAEVRLGCSAELARAAAGVMFGLPSDEVTPADVADALGELTNILAGNLKSLLPGVNALGLPSVSESGGRPRHGTALVEAGFLCRGQPLWVDVMVEKEPALTGEAATEWAGRAG